MPDREKVINDLQDAVNDDWMWQHADYYAKAMENAIALLKEHEPLEPITDGNEHIHVFRCRKCNRILQRNNEMDYCPKCGQPIKWQ